MFLKLINLLNLPVKRVNRIVTLQMTSSVTTLALLELDWSDSVVVPLLLLT